MLFEPYNDLQWFMLGAITVSAVGVVAIVSRWVVTAAWPRWMWRVSVLVGLVYPILLAPAFDLWLVFVTEAATVIVGVTAARAMQRLGARLRGTLTPPREGEAPAEPNVSRRARTAQDSLPLQGGEGGVGFAREPPLTPALSQREREKPYVPSPLAGEGGRRPDEGAACALESALPHDSQLRTGISRWRFSLTDLLALTCFVAVLTAGLARHRDQPYFHLSTTLRWGGVFGILALQGLWLGTRPARWYGWPARGIALVYVARWAAGGLDFAPSLTGLGGAPQYYSQQLVLAFAIPFSIGLWYALRGSKSNLPRHTTLVWCRVSASRLGSLAALLMTVIAYAALLNDPGLPQEPLPTPNAYDQIAAILPGIESVGTIPLDDIWQATDSQLAWHLKQTARYRAKAEPVVGGPSMIRLGRNWREHERLSQLTQLRVLAQAWEFEAIAAARRGNRSAAIAAAWRIHELASGQWRGGVKKSTSIAARESRALVSGRCATCQVGRTIPSIGRLRRGYSPGKRPSNRPLILRAARKLGRDISPGNVACSTCWIR